MQTYSFSGGLSAADGGNNDTATGTGASWTDVCRITPVKAPGQLRQAVTVRKIDPDEPQIIVPILEQEMDVDAKKP